MYGSQVPTFNHEDLPTWDEIYQVIKNKEYVYDLTNPIDEPNLDPRYKVPTIWKNMVLFVNQINYMYHHDKTKYPLKDSEYIIESADGNHIHYEVFALLVNNVVNPGAGNRRLAESHSYTGPFKMNDFNIFHPRISISLVNAGAAKTEFITYHSNPEEFERIIHYIFAEVIDYFENGIGWKDENGRLIESDKSPVTCNSGVDPAL